MDVRILAVAVERTERLDRFLADQLAISRTQAARLVANGAVAVNGERARANRTLAHRDTVEVTMPRAGAPRTLRPHHVPLDVLYEDDALLVLDKPAGLVVHPAPGHWDDTLVNALVARGTRLSEAAPERPGIVHRLDRDTSGIMLVAKSQQSHARLARAIEQKRIRRVYAALVWGHVDGEARTIDAPMARHPGDRKRMLVTATGRAARTTVHQVARFDDCDLVRVTLDTGRTHQIRVHMAYIGHPVVGDAVYGGGGARRVAPARRRPARQLEAVTPRQALHAAWLQLQHPVTGEEHEFRAPWPDDLRPALDLAWEPSTSVARDEVLHYLGFFQ